MTDNNECQWKVNGVIYARALAAITAEANSAPTYLRPIIRYQCATDSRNAPWLCPITNHKYVTDKCRNGHTCIKTSTPTAAGAHTHMIDQISLAIDLESLHDVIYDLTQSASPTTYCDVHESISHWRHGARNQAQPGKHAAKHSVLIHIPQEQNYVKYNHKIDQKVPYLPPLVMISWQKYPRLFQHTKQQRFRSYWDLALWGLFAWHRNSIQGLAACQLAASQRIVWAWTATGLPQHTLRKVATQNQWLYLLWYQLIFVRVCVVTASTIEVRLSGLGVRVIRSGVSDMAICEAIY